MREIKYRGWDKEHNFMFDVIGVSFKENKTSTWRKALPEEFSMEIGRVVGEESEIMQYTGLKDKDGKDIYEGDILKEDDIITEIVFRNLAWQEKLISSPHNHLNDYFPLNQNTTRTSLFGEVIGNIYENPELLTP